MPYRPASYVRPPCIYAIYGGRSGPSADSSIDAPDTHDPAAILP